MNFSTDKAQSCLYVETTPTNQVSVDSKGDIYTAEVDTAKRIQKFLRYGESGCSGTGSPVVGGVLSAK
jgi:hypothetical protein